MATLFARHNVKDFATWKKAYDDFESTRKSHGVTSHAIYQADGNPTDVTVYHEFATMDAAKAFVESPELREAMEHAGVQGAPTIWLANKA